MTFSIAARCRRTGQLGVGALRARPAVGKLVAHVQSGGGAVATQATPNPFLAYHGLPLLDEGRPPEEVLTELLAHDPGREVRQVGMVDHHGRSYAFTGSRTKGWAGHRTGPGYAVQGNRLVGPQTLTEIIRVFEESAELDLAERLVLAIGAGEEAGGDRHGARSATVVVIGDQPYPLSDVRVDDAEHPARELHRLHGVFREEVLPTIRGMPTRDDPMGEAARQALGAQMVGRTPANAVHQQTATPGTDEAL
ncbi:DUF1028 domain-containing protein [Micromonospora sp. MED01]|uniref:DUF1028 domain-containing protein n=1 Tax=Micromonospora alfalfae TaxID=2911212 RepID=UPI001EE7ED26|nr:DUF1028 domain-containing protein [Micromonospora alfalfae]MCG5461294.1 DUF1028 domain-containing protein [Micromonospora alfalfae]